MPIKHKLQYPRESEFKKYRAYLKITMKTFKESSDGFANVKNMVDGYGDKLKGVVSNIMSWIPGDDKKANILSSDEQNTLLSSKYKDTGYGSEGVFEFETYIPADFGISLAGDWSSTELISTEKILETAIKGGAKLFGVGSFVSNQYSLLKNQLQYNTNQALTPLEIKQFKPSFLDTTLNFDFRPKTRDEMIAVDKALRILKQGTIPNSKNGEWFDYPALFDIEVMIKEKDNGVALVTNKHKSTTDLFTNFKDLGMASFNMTSDSGNNVDLKFREDGALQVYKVSMSFTSTKKYYEEPDNGTSEKMTVSKRIDKIMESK